MLEIKNISLSFNETPLLDKVSFSVKKESTLAILGPSGCGKSTLLNIIAGLIQPNEGEIVIQGHCINDLPTHKRDIGYVFQDNQLFPHLNVEENIEFGLKMKRIEKNARKEITRELLSIIGLSNFEKKKIQELSGGEAKRIALARSLAPRPKILLLDEPLTGLDGKLHNQLLSDLAEILKTTKTTSIFVTHNEDEAKFIADSIFRLN